MQRDSLKTWGNVTNSGKLDNQYIAIIKILTIMITLLILIQKSSENIIF